LHCYYKTRQNDLAQKIADRLKNVFGIDAKMPGDDVAAANNEKLLNATYQKVYDLFIQGDFEAALNARQQADSLLGNSYWRPQLLYIQSIYHIKKTEDSLAIAELNKLVQTFPDHGLAEKSKTLIDVVKRRKEIEEYLTKLEVKREEEDAPVKLTPAPALAAQAAKAMPYPTAAERKAAEDSVAAALAKQKEKYLKEKEAYEAALKAQEEKEKKAKEAAEALAAQKALEEKLAAEKAAAEKALAEKQAAEKAAFEKELADKLAAEKAAEEQALAEKHAAEKIAQEKKLAEKAAAEKAQAEKELADKQAREREALEKETANKAEAERLLKQKQEAEKAALEKELADKAAAEKAAAEKELNEKLAAEKAAEEKALAEKQQKEKAEAEKLQQEKAAAEKLAAQKAAEEKRQAELLAAEKLASEQAAAERLAAEKEKARKEAEALARQNMLDNVVIGKPVTPSPFTINGNEPQVVVIVLENIDPAYVNEVSYAFSNSTLRNSDKAQVNVVKRKLRDKLWIVELQSEAFVNMQASYDYIKYIKPIASQSLLNWLDTSKYYIIPISKNNLKLLEQNTNAALYYQVLKEAVPQKF
jgi:myosin heavy subunit